jgi:glycopeptide antibiotics resistance protein
MRAVITFLLLLLLVRWLRFEFRRKVSAKRYWKWVAATLVLQLVTGFTSGLAGDKLGNIILHAVGGGVVSLLLFTYLIKTYDVRYNWRVEVVLLFCFVSALGVLNELAEFAGELLHLGVYSFDTQDTWRDLAANTVGALLAWGVIKVYTAVFIPAKAVSPRQ